MDIDADGRVVRRTDRTARVLTSRSTDGSGVTFPRKVALALPSGVTVARLLAVPAAIWLIGEGLFEAAFWVFLAAGLSDALDGALARLLDARSVLGRLLDAVADKALLISVFVALALVDVMPVWMATLVVGRDLLIIGGVVLAHASEQEIALDPLLIGKLSTLAQLSLAGWTLAVAGLGVREDAVSFALMAIAAAATLASGLAYGYRWFSQTRWGGTPR